MENRLRTLLLASVVSVAIAAPALAQETPGDKSGTPQAAGGGQSAATPTNAPAEPAPAEAARAARGGDGSGDIIVTARRVEERLQDVPISITVFNQQQLANRNVTNAVDLTTYTPSLSSDSRFGANNTTFAIRGFTQDINTPPSVGVYFADVISPRAASNNLPGGNGAGPGSFFDLQNVQILKGPQGTLFGRNTTGGAILLVPQKPTSSFGGYVEGSYGNYDMKRIQAVLNLPLSDVARFRIGVDHQDRDGFLKNNSGVGPGRYNDIGYTTARASLVVDLTPDLETYFIGSYTRSDSNGFGSKVVYADPKRGGSAAFLLAPLAQAQINRQNAGGYGFYGFETDFQNPKTVQDTWQIINTTTWKASDALTVKNIVSYSQLIIDLQSPIFGTAFDAFDAPAPIPAILNITQPGARAQFAASYPLPQGHTAQQSTFTEEFQIQGSALDDKLSYQTGAYYELSEPLGKSGSISPIFAYCNNIYALDCSTPLATLGAGGASITSAETKFRNVGLYAQASYAITDKLKLTGGFRYTWDRTEVSAQSINYGININPLTGARTGTYTVTCSLLSGVPENINSAPGAATPTSTRPLGGPVGAGNDCSFTVPTQKSSAPTWLVDLDYKPTDDILLYAKWSRGYRSGGVTAQGPGSLRQFQQEKVDAYEGGMKLSFRGPIRGTFNVSGFYNDFSNQQVQLAVVRAPLSFFTAIQNLGKSRIYGAEVEASITPFDGFTVDASYAYLNTKVKSITGIPQCATDPSVCGYTITPSAFPGDELQLTPKHKLSTTASYTLPLDESVGKVSVGATFTYTARQLAAGASTEFEAQLAATAAANNAAFTPNPYLYLQHTYLVNLNLNWSSIAGAPVDLSLFATNVTGKKYLAGISGTLNTVGFENVILGEPRTYGARLRYRFGAGGR